MQDFELKEEHLTLLRNMYIEFDDNEYDGAPAVDIKRPYGNSGDQAYQVYEVLTGEEWDYDEDGDEMPDDLHDYYMKLHMETGIALQLLVLHAKLEPGIFKKEEKYNRRSWQRVDS